MSKARVFIDEINMRGAASREMGDRASLSIDLNKLRDLVTNVTQWDVERFLRGSTIYLEENKIELDHQFEYLLINDRSIDLRPGIISAMVEYACVQKNAAIVLLSGDHYMRSAVLKCLSRGAYVHVLGVAEKISPRLTSISSPNFRFTHRSLDLFGVRVCVPKKTICLTPNAQQLRICRWFYADNIPGKPVPATGSWVQGCSAHANGVCPDIHPDQPEWQQAVEQLQTDKIVKFPCRKGFFCANPVLCKDGHSRDHLRHNRLLKCAPIKRKSKNCPRAHGCKFALCPSLCSFLHDGEIALCLWCNNQHQPDCFTSQKALDFAN